MTVQTSASDADRSGTKTSETRFFDIESYRERIWRARKSIAGVTAIGLVISLIIAQIVPYKYAGTIVVRPPPDMSQGLLGSALSSMSGSLGGMLSLGDSGDYDSFNVLLTDNSVGNYIARHNPDIMHKIFSSHWDGDKQRWTNDGVLNWAKNAVRMVIGMDPWQPPNGEDLMEYLNKKVSIDNDYKTNITTISYEDEDPQLASEVVTAMSRGADNIMRQHADERSSKRIKYLQRILPTVSQADERDALIQLLQMEEQTQMTVRADVDFAFRPVSNAEVPLRPAGPSRGLIFFGVTGLSLLFGMLRALYFPGFLRWRRGETQPARAAVTASSRASTRIATTSNGA